MTTLLPSDSLGRIMPVLRPKATGGSHSITTSGTTARNTTPFDVGSANDKDKTRVIGVCAVDEACYVRLGGGSVEAAATDHYVPAGVYLYFRVDHTTTHIAAIRSSAGGSLKVSEYE